MSLQLYGDPSRNTRESGAGRHDRIAVHADPPVVLHSRPNLLLPSSSSLAGGLRWYSGSRYHIDVDGELGGGVRIVGRKDRRRVRW